MEHGLSTQSDLHKKLTIPVLAERPDNSSPLRARAASTFTISKHIEEPDSAQPKYMVNTQGSFDASNFRGTSSLG